MRYRPGRWEVPQTPAQFQPLSATQPLITPTIADNYHARLYRIGRPCRWVGAVDAVGRPVVGRGQWVSDVVKEVGYAA